MFKRGVNVVSRSLVFLVGPSLKYSYQNVAANLPKSVIGQPVSPQQGFPSSSISVTSVRKEVSKLLSSQVRYKFAKDGVYSKSKNGRKLVTVGFSVGLLGFFEKKEEEELSVEDKILMELKRAILAIQEGEIKKAEGHLKKAWDMSEEENLDKVQTQILDIRANLAFQIGDLIGAEKLFKIVCQRLVYHQDVTVKDNAIVEISLKLSQIMALTGRFDESMSGFQYCADTQREKIEKNGVKDEDTLVLAAWSLHSLAQAYLSRYAEHEVDENLVKKAADLAQQAYDYAIVAIGADSHQAVAISSDLASILALQGNVDAALARYKQCEEIVADKHEYLQPSIRVNTGSVQLQKGNYEEAERLCREAKKLAGKYRDKESALRAEECIQRSSIMKAENQGISTKPTTKTKTGEKYSSSSSLPL